MKKIDMIITADWHLKDTTPISRTDNYWEAQETKVDFVLDLAKKYNCPIFIAGDLFHKAKSSQYLEQWIITKLKDTSFLILPGQHDLLSHAIENFNKSSIGVLKSAGINIVENPFEGLFKYYFKNRKIGLIHKLIENPYNKKDKILNGTKAVKLLKDNPNLDLIICGDNHQSFTIRYKDRLLVNPGSLMRTTAEQINFQPVVYLWDAEKNDVMSVDLPIEKNVISREHIEIQEKRDKRIEAFVNRINDDYEIELSFENNLKKFINKNKIRKGVQEIIWECIEEV